MSHNKSNKIIIPNYNEYNKIFNLLIIKRSLWQTMMIRITNYIQFRNHKNINYKVTPFILWGTISKCDLKFKLGGIFVGTKNYCRYLNNLPISFLISWEIF